MKFIKNFFFPMALILINYLHQLNLIGVSAVDESLSEPLLQYHKTNHLSSIEGESQTQMQRRKAQMKTKIEKHPSSQFRTITKKGFKGHTISVKVPTGDEILKHSHKKNKDAGYWRKEQRVVRSARGFLNRGEAKDEDEAFRLANEHIRLKSIKDQKLSKGRKRIHKKRPLDYNSRKNWTSRRVVGLLAEPNNGIANYAKAFEVADQLWIERIRIGNENRKAKERNEKELKKL